MIAKLNVPTVLFNSEGKGRIATYDDLLEPTLRFDISRSVICIREYRERAEIFASEFLAQLNLGKAGWGVRKEQHDWLLAERLARDFIAEKGCGLPNQEIIRQCQDRYEAHLPEKKPLDTSQFAEMVALLKQEHLVSDE
jgi:hypothetical protein